MSSILDPNQERTIIPTRTGRLHDLCWEHRTLPQQLKQKQSPLLLNFCNTAPLSYSHQVVTIHDLATLEHPEWFSKAFARYYQSLLPRIAQQAKRIVTVSLASKERIIRLLNIPETKIKIIPPILDDNLIESESKSPQDVNQPFVLMIGGQDPRKQVQRAANTIHNQLQQHGISLIVVERSDGPFAHPNIQTRPYQSIQGPDDGELKWLYQNALCLIQPSLYEGYGLIGVEALALGCPVTSSDIEVHREVLGDHTAYFNASNLAGLEESIENIIENRGERRPIVLGNSKEHAKEQWLNLISELA